MSSSINQPLTIASHLWYTCFCSNRQVYPERFSRRAPARMLPLVALKEVSLGPAKERPQSGRVGHMTGQLTLAALASGLSTLDCRLSTFCPQLFTFTHFPKNPS